MSSFSHLQHALQLSPSLAVWSGSILKKLRKKGSWLRSVNKEIRNKSLLRMNRPRIKRPASNWNSIVRRPSPLLYQLLIFGSLEHWEILGLSILNIECPFVVILDCLTVLPSNLICSQFLSEPVSIAVAATKTRCKKGLKRGRIRKFVKA